MKFDESVDDALPYRRSQSTDVKPMLSTRNLAFSRGIKDPEHPGPERATFSFLLLFATRHDTMRDRNHSAVYSAVIRVGDPGVCLSATLYKVCDFSCHFGSSPIRANTSRSLALLYRKFYYLVF